MNARRLATSVACVALCGAALPTLTLGHDEHASAQRPTAATNERAAGELVRIVREVTARYRDVSAATADGYELHFGCVSGSEWGAMGLHYVRMDLVGDGAIDARQPEIVIYEPLPNGGRRLIGADYLVLAADWHARNSAAPQIEGQLMHLIESPNRYGLPAFYTLHVWAWKKNRNGTLTNWHPDVSCEHFED